MPAVSDLPAGLRLACPDCGADALCEPAGLRCARCNREWPLAEGVASFGQATDIPLDFSGEQMAELLAIAEHSGWAAALHDYVRLLDAAIYRRAVDEYRAQWRCLVPLAPNSRVLDLRCGWGPITISLAHDCALVAAADVRYEYARFTALRAASLGLRHVQAVCLDPQRRLPFASGSFDGVVVHEMLEWTQPGRMLAEVGRVLAPGGWVFACAPNALSATRLLLGGLGRKRPRIDVRREPAAAARGGSAVRRERAHTLGAYTRALAAAGLGHRTPYAILPSVTEPFYLVPLAAPGALRHFLDTLFNHAGLRLALTRRNLLGPYQAAQSMWRAARWLPVETVARQVMPGFGILARRA